MKFGYENGVLTIILAGRIDASNAQVIESEIREIRAKYPADTIAVDCDQLEYISSAGLRVILRLKQEVERTSLINVHAEFYEVLDTTGFNELMEIKKAFRIVSLEGCELIGQGANGKVYRLNTENIIKVYTDTDSLSEIQHSRELSRAAFVLGIPTAIPYDVVQVLEGGYGSVYEMLNAQSYAKLLTDGDKSLEQLVKMSIDLLKLIHSRIVRQEFIPGMKDTALGWAVYLKDHLPAAQFEKLYELIDAVPEDMHILHGDYHFRNIMYQNGESMLIDMDKLSHGHPIFELAAMYNSYCGFASIDPSNVERFLGVSSKIASDLWHNSLEQYLGTQDQCVLRAVEDRAKIIGHARLMRYYIRRNMHTTGEGSRQVAYSRTLLEELLPRTETLLF